MNILHITPYYAPAYAYGGVVRAVEGMAVALAGRGHQVTVLTTDALDPTARFTGPLDEQRDGVRVLRAPNLFLRGQTNLSTPNTMQPVARELLPTVDIVHCHEFRTVENLLVTPLAAQMGKPLILSPHGTLPLDTGRGGLKALWDKLLSPAVAQRFDCIIGLTQQEVDDAQALWPKFGRRRIPAKFCVIPNGINPAEFAHPAGRNEFRRQHSLGDGPICLFMARLHPRKGARLLAEAFLKADVPGARLVIAGPDEGDAPSLTAAIPGGERIVITGYLGGAERLAALAAAEVFALPAVGEGLPMAVLEAMGAGLPVIVTPGCHLPEVAERGAGLEVEREVEPLAGALRTLLNDAGLRAQMGAAGRALVSEKFTWEAVAAQLEAVYLLGNEPL
jgi:glycosyltransferase involved in cell wall biosynthesis